ncbi:hypothetical protein PVK06_048369 [Gossypium arboreum]|uniref:Uncharacterized protein n=1 Tax=Gossypium arboreum TaxID=29729 RepID=A0ABR0MIG2_GOSAR|nr:hypothetical protein PVK06_048369 [Gossypium arboreum]
MSMRMFWVLDYLTVFHLSVYELILTLSSRSSPPLSVSFSSIFLNPNVGLGKQNCEEQSVSLRRVSVQELEDSAILPTWSSDNSELGNEALTRVVMEILEKVFEARIRESSETL